MDRNGIPKPLGLPPGPYWHPRISPNGKQLVFYTDDGKEQIVWIYDLDGKTSLRRLTFGGKNFVPIWSADSQRVMFQSDREGDLGLFWQRADGTGVAERVTKPEGEWDWSLRQRVGLGRPDIPVHRFRRPTTQASGRIRFATRKRPCLSMLHHGRKTLRSHRMAAGWHINHGKKPDREVYRAAVPRDGREVSDY